MIYLEPYSSEFEKEYWEAVNNKIDNATQEKIIESSKKFLPPGFFSGKKDEFFKSLVLAPFEKLQEAVKYITTNSSNDMQTICFRKKSGHHKKDIKKKLYQTIHDAYDKVADSTEEGSASIRIRIVKNTGFTVCPYCNRDYINCRGDNVSGAQLDHFFSKSEFPVFAVCLYNLIPVCGNCNRIKGAKKFKFASPFDNNIDWENGISFNFIWISKTDVKIILHGEGDLDNNITGMKINEAYQIHGDDVLEIYEKAQVYNNTQIQEFKDVLSQAKLTDLQIKRAIFGPEITKQDMRKKPLGKLKSDLHKKLKIY